MLEESVRANLAGIAAKPLLDSRVFAAESVLLEAKMPGFRVDALLECEDERLLVEFRKSNPVSPENGERSKRHACLASKSTFRDCTTA